MSKKVKHPQLPHERNWNLFVAVIVILALAFLLAMAISQVAAAPA